MKNRILYTLLTLLCCLSLLFTLASCGGETETTTAAGDNETTAPGGNDQKPGGDQPGGDQPGGDKPTTQPTEGLTYELNADGQSYTLIGTGNVNAEEIVIPETYEGLPVTAIGEGAFQDCTVIIRIVISANVTVIGDGAFSGCISLTAVVIPEGVTEIGDAAFYRCEVLVKVVLPETVTVIGSGAFEGCSNLTEISVPDSVTSIGSGAFVGCDKLQYTQSNGGQYIGNANNPHLILVKVTDLSVTSFTLHLEAKLIASLAFENCTLLVEIILPDGLQVIESNAFTNCDALVSIVIPESVKDLAEDAFADCDILIEVTMPDGSTVTPHQHTYSDAWSYDETHHWHAATCEHSDAKKDSAAHQWDNGTVTTPASCGGAGTMTYACACGATRTEDIPQTNEHTYSDAWTYDSTHHWHAATCGHNDLKQDSAEHQWDNGTVTTPATCGGAGTMTYTCACGAIKTEDIPQEEHPFADTWSYDETHHWHAATCEHSNEKKDSAEHQWDEGTITMPPSCGDYGEIIYTCSCGAVQYDLIPKTEHIFSEVWSYDPTHHWHAALCGHNDQRVDYTVHDWDEGTVTTPATCDHEGTMRYTCICGAVKTTAIPKEEHPYSNEWSYDETHHWHAAACGHTDEKKDSAEHQWDEGYCTVCGKAEALAGGDSYTRINAAGEEDADGDYILFGSYPQSVVSDSALQSTLESLAGLPTGGGWTSYGYYISGSVSDYMWYRDVEHSGDRYRAVYFTSYRPTGTDRNSSTGNSNQDNNGYTTNRVYFFKYEPIKWRILKEQDGKALLLCEMLIDSQEYYHSTSNRTIDGTTVYANNYEYSNIRAWLNNNFYNTAFNDLQKQLIQLTMVDNSANSYACRNTEDHVFLLSQKEVTTAAYGFASNSTYDTARQKQTTDYAQCQGAYTSSGGSYDGNGWWWLRSPDSYSSNDAREVDYGGYANNYSYVIYSADGGVCPALWISL